ncbi:MAG: menaquinone-dependent protoporphyrinogen IX dehydrogenase [Nitrosomonadales bacterium]|nr:menaquinone-dependent protoporphyrinogen IX dehydrogenase [Nitrosomonadales bacterium]
MANVLIVYSTTDGHTRKICLRLQNVIERQHHGVAVMPLQECADADLHAFDKIVIGASIRYGKHSPHVVDFIKRNVGLLDSKPNAFFSVNVVARKPEKNRPETNPYMRKFLRQIPWRPKRLEVFAGKIDYSIYRFIDRSAIRFIMWMTRGPTDLNAVVEFTDWQRVEDFGELIGKM